MPKLLSVNSYHYRRGGSDVVYLEHAALMEQVGLENGFFSMRHPNNLITPWSRYFVDELEFGHDYSLRQKLLMAAKAVYSFEAQRRLRGLIRDYRPDIAHLHCIYHHLSPSILPVFADAGIPTVMTAHDLKIACPGYKMLNSGGVCERCRSGSVLNVLRHRCVRGSLSASAIVAVESGLQRFMQTYRRHLDRVVVPSLFFLEKFVEWGWPRQQLVYIPNYVDAATFTSQFDAGNYFLYFGRMAPEKGVGTLLRAANAAGVRLKLAGIGPELESLQALNADLGGQGEFLGFRSGHELHDLIRAARAVVLPSEWYENAPMSVLESFALGKPVVGARIGGIPEMVSDGDVGWTFKSGDAAELAELLTQVASMRNADIERMGRSARALVAERFSRQRYVDSMVDLYADLGVKVA